NMKKFICILMIAVLLVLSAGCTQQTETPEVTTPPTGVPTQPPATPSMDYSAWIDRGNSEIIQGRAAIQSGRDSLHNAMVKQGVSPEVVTILADTEYSFSAARTHFLNAGDYYSQASGTAPDGIKAQIALAESMVPQVLRSCQLYLDATHAAQANDWYNANNLENQANLMYQAGNSSLNEVLQSLGLVS
ncbi:MAG: hypothetical protein LUQ25_01170, partial [Methanoregulaceae archaeon]|nr:hypothetical protein [Methanoregulaceae archaeon]